MANTWILVANGAQATIYHAKNNHVLQEVEQFSHPESRMRTSELVSDRQGRGHESNTNGRYALPATTSPKEVEFASFAKTISNYLEEALKESKFSKLYVAASPHFLGLLREAFSSGTTRLIAGEIDKDITQLDASRVREHLPEVI